MEVKKYQAFWRGAFILTAAGLLTKILSAFYRIPYQNIAGDLAFYTYQQVYPIYGLCLVFAVYGFPAVISGMVSEEKAKGREKRVEEIVYISFWFLTFLCVSAGLLLFFGASFIAGMMGDEQLYPIIRVASFSFLFLPFISVVRGYFQGLHNMIPTAVSQVVEQLLRVFVIVTLSFYFVIHGFDVYTIGAGAMLGSAVGGAVSVIVLGIYLRHKLRKMFFRSWNIVAEKGTIIRMLFWQGITVCVSHLVLIVIQFVDSLTFYNMLTGAGESANEAKIIKGIYDRGIPLIQLGTVVATSFSLALIPAMKEAIRRKDITVIRSKIRLAMKITLVLALGASIGLACIIKPTNEMLFKNEAGSSILAILSLSVLFGALAITSATALQGLSYTAAPAVFTIVGACVKYVGNSLLIPGLGARGAAIATVVALMVIAILNMLFLARATRCFLLERMTTVRVTFSCIGMVLFLMLYLAVFDVLFPGAGRGEAAINAVLGAVLGGFVYVLLLIKLRVFTEEEIGSILYKNIPLQKRMRKEKGA